LVSQTKRLFEYIDGKPASVGFGFDRWFVFLHKLGVAVSAELLIATAPILFLFLSLIRLRRLLAQGSQSRHEMSEPIVSSTLT